MHHLFGVFRRANDPGPCSPPARNRPETVNQVPKERNAMNRRELLGVAGAMGAGMTLGGAHVFADGHGKAENRMMAPLGNHHLHFCGIHCAKKDPRIQIITQHYCGMVGEGMHQCLLYDSVGTNARLLGVEYIIADEAFRKLPDVEKRYWHPHTYEVLGGGLIAPGMKPDDELEFMKGMLLTWDKRYKSNFIGLPRAYGMWYT